MAAGYSGPREQVHRQTIQEIKTAWPQAQGRTSIHQGTSATCGCCSFLVPNPALQWLLL